MNGETRPRTRAKAYVGGIGFDSKKLAERVAAMVERVAQSAYERGEAKGNAEGFRAGIERAAQVTESLDFISGDANDWRDDCAEAIRALLSDGASHDQR